MNFFFAERESGIDGMDFRFLQMLSDKIGFEPNVLLATGYDDALNQAGASRA